MKEIISSLDIGSSTIKLVVCEVYKNETNVLAVSEVKSKGVKKGIIVNPEETIISLREVFSRCEDMLNIKIDKVLLTIPSYYAEFLMTEAKIDITHENNLINGDDIVRVLQACVYNKIPNNKDMLTEAEDAVYLRNLLKELSQDTREVIILRIYEEMKFKDIAKIMGCSVSTTKSRFRLGVNQLKKLMENDYER